MSRRNIILLICAALLCIGIVKHKLVRKRVIEAIENVHLFVAKIEIAIERFNTPEIDKHAPKKFYAINLESSTNKMESVRAQSDKYNLNIERFDAVNGYKAVIVDPVTKNSIEASELKKNPRLLVEKKEYNIYCYPESYKQGNKPDFVYLNGECKGTIVPHNAILTAGEIGISCSSRMLWKKIADSNQVAVIFEDDISLGNDFDKKIQNIFAALPKKWDLVYIDYLSYENDAHIHSSLKKLNETLLKHDGTFSTWGAHAYIINSSSAKKLLKVQDKLGNIPLDNILVEAIRSLRLDAYITTEKTADVNTNFGSDITSMGRPY